MTGFSKQVRELVQMRAQGICERCGLFSHSLQYHHRRPRGMGGSRRADTNQAANCVLVCSYCHRTIEDYREAALELGWLVRRMKKPCEAPIYRHGQWVLLDDLGYATPINEKDTA